MKSLNLRKSPRLKSDCREQVAEQAQYPPDTGLLIYNLKKYHRRLRTATRAKTSAAQRTPFSRPQVAEIIVCCREARKGGQEKEVLRTEKKLCRKAAQKMRAGPLEIGFQKLASNHSELPW